MARHEGDLRVSAEETLSLNELLELFGNGAESEGRSRENAIACYLSGDDGWLEAVKFLGGTFAGGAGGLRERKSD